MSRQDNAMMNAICVAMGVPEHLFWDFPVEPLHWLDLGADEQHPGESIIQWGSRLNSLGLLDNPDIRWQYQQAVLSAPWRWLKNKVSFKRVGG